jgi:hypothetical protein
MTASLSRTRTITRLALTCSCRWPPKLSLSEAPTCCSHKTPHRGAYLCALRDELRVGDRVGERLPCIHMSYTNRGLTPWLRDAELALVEAIVDVRLIGNGFD